MAFSCPFGILIHQIAFLAALARRNRCLDRRKARRRLGRLATPPHRMLDALLGIGNDGPLLVDSLRLHRRSPRRHTPMLAGGAGIRRPRCTSRRRTVTRRRLNASWTVVLRSIRRTNKGTLACWRACAHARGPRWPSTVRAAGGRRCTSQLLRVMRPRSSAS